MVHSLRMSGRDIKRVCNVISSSLLKWKLASKEGKIILEFIMQKVYGNSNKNEDTEDADVNEVLGDVKKDFDEELNSKCNSLRDILDRMRDVLGELESGEEKCLGLSQLCDLSSSSSSSQKINSSLVNSSNSQNSSIIELDHSVVYTNDLTRWTQVLSSCYRSQLKMNEIVCRNICRLSSREEALFHVSVWVCQPALHTEAEAATVAIEQTLKSCSQ